jgi:hypothetical protein
LGIGKISKHCTKPELQKEKPLLKMALSITIRCFMAVIALKKGVWGKKLFLFQCFYHPFLF